MPKKRLSSVHEIGAHPQTRPTIGGLEAMRSVPSTQLRLLASANATPPRLIDQIEGYEDYLIGEQRRPKGRAKYLWTIQQVIVWLGEEATHAELNPATVQRYKEVLGKRGSAGSSVINALAVIRDFCLWAKFMGYRNDEPTEGIKRPPKRGPNPNPLYPDEIALLMAAIEQDPPAAGSRERWYWERNRLAVLLFLNTGLRISELAALRWGDIHLRAGVLDVRPEAAKNGHPRTVPIPPALKEELTKIPPEKRKSSAPVLTNVKGKRLSSNGLNHIFDRWLPERLDAFATRTGENAEIHLYAHRLRHTFASLLVWEDIDLRTVQEILGHRQLDTTAHYTKTDARRKQEAAARLPDFAMLGRQFSNKDF